MSERSQAINALIRHERDRTLRSTGQAHRYLTDALFHASLDLMLRAVAQTCEVFAEHPLFDSAGPDSVEACVRASVHLLVKAQATSEQMRAAALQQITLTPPDPEILRLLGRSE